MSPIYYKGLTIFEAFTDVKNTSFANCDAYLSEPLNLAVFKDFVLCHHAKIFSDLLDDASLEHVANIHPFCKLRNKCTFANAFSATN